MHPSRGISKPGGIGDSRKEVGRGRGLLVCCGFDLFWAMFRCKFERKLAKAAREKAERFSLDPKRT